MSSTTAIAYDPLAPAVQADPYPVYAALRHSAPVHYVESLDAYAVSRHADVRRVMHDHATFSNEAMAALVARPVEYAADAGLVEDGEVPTYPVSIVGAAGDTHSRLRLIVNRGFTPRRIGRLEGEVRAIARGLVGALVARGTGDLQSGLAAPLPTIVIAEMMGVSPDRRDDFRGWSEQMVRGVFEPLDPAGQAAVAAAGEAMGTWLDEQIDARLGRAGDDLISVLLRAEEEGGALTHDELRVFVFTLLVAGSITTAYLIGTAAKLLAARPLWARRLRADHTLIAAWVEETLRYDAPVQLMFRTATAETAIAGATIPKGATVLALIGSANRDERVFTEPDVFDPGRDASDHLAFGHGIHFCLGAALARLEARIAIEELLTGASRLEPAGDPEPVVSLVFRGPTSLPLRYGTSPH
jgi:cytochrome P450